MYALSQKYPHKRAFITGAGLWLRKSHLRWSLAADGWTIGMADNNPQSFRLKWGDWLAKAGGKAADLSY
jgi:hypothetical protein